jgi:hypothetical protein
MKCIAFRTKKQTISNFYLAHMENAFGVLSECRQRKFGPQTLPFVQKYFGSKVAENPRGFHFQGRKWIEEVLRGEF